MSAELYSVPTGVQAVIYRLTEPRATFADVTRADPKVELGSHLAGITEWSSGEERHRPSVPQPQAEATNKPDAGAASFNIMLNCVVNRMDMGTAPAMRTDSAATTLRKWSVLPQVVPGVYDRGRIGLWFWPDEALSHHPTRSAGYKINNILVSAIPNMPSRTILTVHLEYAGEFSEHDGVGTP